jgi:hypothetical protein
MMVSPMWAAQSGRSFGPIIVGTKDSIDITDTKRPSHPGQAVAKAAVWG